MRHFMLVSLCLAAVACTGQATTPTSPSSATSSALVARDFGSPIAGDGAESLCDVTFTKWFPGPGR